MKKILITLLMIFSTDLFACRISWIDPTFRDTQAAKILMLVEKMPKKNPMDVTFQATLPWKTTFKTFDSECTSLTSKKSGFFLFLTAMDEKRLKRETIGMGAGIMIDVLDIEKMNKELEWITKRQEIPNGHPNTFWSFCREDQECVQVKNSCDQSVGVNEKYKENYTNYIKKNKYPKKCGDKIKESASSCINYLCS